MMRLILSQDPPRRAQGAWSRALLALGMALPFVACSEVSGVSDAPLVVVTTARGPPRHSEPQELFLGPKKYVLLEIHMENIVNNTPR